MSVTRWKSHKAIKRELALGLKPARRMTDAQVIHHRGELIRELRRQVREWKSAALFNNQTIRTLAERLPVPRAPLTLTGPTISQIIIPPENEALAKRIVATNHIKVRMREWRGIQQRFTADRKRMNLAKARVNRTRRLNQWKKKWHGSR